MTYKRTKDVLECIQEIHHKLGDFYHRIAGKAERQRVKMLLDYMCRHERHLEASIAEYEKKASIRVLCTWFKYTADMPDLNCCDFLEKFKPEMAIDTMIGIILRVDDCLIEFYRSIAELCEVEPVREVFRNLLEMEKREEKQFVRDAMASNEI